MTIQYALYSLNIDPYSISFIEEGFNEEGDAVLAVKKYPTITKFIIIKYYKTY